MSVRIEERPDGWFNVTSSDSKGVIAKHRVKAKELHQYLDHFFGTKEHNENNCPFCDKIDWKKRAR